MIVDLWEVVEDTAPHRIYIIKVSDIIPDPEATSTKKEINVISHALKQVFRCNCRYYEYCCRCYNIALLTIF